MGQIKINDRMINFNDAKAELGVKHILTKEHGEREDFFFGVKAKQGGWYRFEDKFGNNFSIRRLQSGIYEITARGSDSGGWF